MKKNFTLRSFALAVAIFLAQDAFGQLQVDKSFELTGAFPNNQILGAGALGIGTASPVQKLDVVGGDINVGSGSGYRINNTATSGQYLRGDGTRFVSSSISASDIPSNIGSYVQNQSSVNQVADFRISGVGYIMGNVGIGTTSPVQKLDVVGGDINVGSGAGYRINNTAASGQYLRGDGTRFVSSTISASDIPSGVGSYVQNQSAVNQAADFRISGVGYIMGNVGIGTTSPAQKLDVVGGDINVSSGSGYRINNTAASGQYLRGDGTRFVSSAISAGDLPSGSGSYIQNQVGADQSAGFRIDGNGLFSSGSVGIGTVTPATKLDVADGVFKLSGSTGSTHGILFDRGGVIAASTTQASIFQEWNGIPGNFESLTFRADNYKFQNHDGTEEIYFRNGFIGVRVANPSYYLQVGDQITGNNVDYSLGVIRHGTPTNPGTYTANSPALKIDDLSNDGPAANETAGLVHINAGRIDDADANAGNANLLSVQNNNGHALVVKGNRRVGINTNTPGTGIPLTIAHESSYTFPAPGAQAKGAINIRMTTSNRESGITFSANNADDAQAGMYVHQDGGAGTHMYLATTANYAAGPQARLTILNSGNVGIGTVTPTTKLEVSDGVVNLSGSLGSQHGIVFDRGTSVSASAAQGSIFQELNGVGGNSEALTLRSDNFKFQNYDGTDEIIFRSGRLGIGNTNPGAPLTITHEGSYSFPAPGTQAKGAINIRMTTSNRESGITFSSNNADDAQAGIYVHQDGSAGTHMYLATTGSYAVGPQARMTILNTGNVGVGVVVPLSTMHIRSTSISSFLGASYGNMTLDAPYTDAYFMPIDFLSSPSASPAVRIAAQMNGFGSLLVMGTSANYASGITNTGFVMDHVGNVAIGYTPTFYSNRLDVNGNTRSVSYTVFSDERFKMNIEALENPLDKITRMKGVSYNWRKDEFPEINFNDSKQVGFIAQEIEKIVPEAVQVDNKGYYSVNYTMLIPLLVEGMKTQQQQLDKQQSQIDKLTEQNNRLLEMLQGK